MTCAHLPVVLSILVTIQGVIITLYILKSYSKDLLSDSERWSKHVTVKEQLYETIGDHNRRISESRHESRLNFQPRVNSLQQKISDEPPKLIVAIFSGGSFTARRNAIRESWMKDCKRNKGVVCKFFTDGLNVRGEPLPTESLRLLQDESETNDHDLVVTNSASGRNFAVRLLRVMEWAQENVEYDFFLRIDDDQYLCVDRLAYELPYRPRERLYWGHIHCVQTVIRVDEGWLMLTEDLVRNFLKTKDTLQCSRYGDQAVAMWIYDLMKKKTITWYGDERIFHHPPVSTIVEFKERKEICHTYISLHGSYPTEMKIFQLIQEREKKIFGNVYDVTPVIDTCPFRRDSFNWKWFDPTYYTKPVPCKDDPIWTAGGEQFIGRSIDIRSKLNEEAANDKRWKGMHHVDSPVINNTASSSSSKKPTFNIIKE